jgi:TRAP-type uncharacterized transport system substrate-binding protein
LLFVFEYFRLAGEAMQKSWAILACVLVFGGIGSLQAQPLDSKGATADRQSPNALAHHSLGVHEAGSKPAASTRAGRQSASKPLETPREKITDVRAAGTAVTNSDRKEPKPKTNSTDGSDAVLSRGSAMTEPALSKRTDPRIAIIMARPEIRSVSDLAGKNIAIEDKQSASAGVVQIAIAAAGATGVRLAEGSAQAFDRVINGEVAAAVLMLAYPEAAEAFPEFAGFNIFRVPLTPERSQVARTDFSPPAKATAASDSAMAKIEDLRPTGAIATGSHTRTTEELVAAAMAVAERMTIAAADPQAIAPAPANVADHRFAILMARSDIKSLSDLAGKKIAIDDKQASSGSNVRTAIAAVADVEVSEGQKKPIDRLIGGEVSAALLSLVSREAADAFPEIAGFKIFRIPLTSETPRAKIADLPPQIKPAAAADTPGAAANTPGAAADTPGAAADTPGAAADTPGAAADDLRSAKIQDLVMAATAVAELMSVGVTDQGQPERNATGGDRSATALPGAATTTPSPSGDGDPRVAILMARPDIKSVSDLAGKEIAIDDKQSASSRKVRTAIAAAGAAQVQISERQTKAINRLILAEVPAAVLTLVSPEAAEVFPEVAGFRIFRVPLSPRSVLVKHP